MENEEMNTTNQDNISKMRGKDTINNASSGLARKYNGTKVADNRSFQVVSEVEKGDSFFTHWKYRNSQEIDNNDNQLPSQNDLTLNDFDAALYNGQPHPGYAPNWAHSSNHWDYQNSLIANTNTSQLSSNDFNNIINQSQNSHINSKKLTTTTTTTTAAATNKCETVTNNSGQLLNSQIIQKNKNNNTVKKSKQKSSNDNTKISDKVDVNKSVENYKKTIENLWNLSALWSAAAAGGWEDIDMSGQYPGHSRPPVGTPPPQTVWNHLTMAQGTGLNIHPTALTNAVLNPANFYTHSSISRSSHLTSQLTPQLAHSQSAPTWHTPTAVPSSKPTSTTSSSSSTSSTLSTTAATTTTTNSPVNPLFNLQALVDNNRTNQSQYHRGSPNTGQNTLDLSTTSDVAENYSRMTQDIPISLTARNIDKSNRNGNIISPPIPLNGETSSDSGISSSVPTPNSLIEPVSLSTKDLLSSSLLTPKISVKNFESHLKGVANIHDKIGGGVGVGSVSNSVNSIGINIDNFSQKMINLPSSVTIERILPDNNKKDIEPIKIKDSLSVIPQPVIVNLTSRYDKDVIDSPICDLSLINDRETKKINNDEMNVRSPKNIPKRGNKKCVDSLLEKLESGSKKLGSTENIGSIIVIPVDDYKDASSIKSMSPDRQKSKSPTREDDVVSPEFSNDDSNDNTKQRRKRKLEKPVRLSKDAKNDIDDIGEIDSIIESKELREPKEPRITVPIIDELTSKFDTKITTSTTLPPPLAPPTLLAPPLPPPLPSSSSSTSLLLPPVVEENHKKQTNDNLSPTTIDLSNVKKINDNNIGDDDNNELKIPDDITISKKIQKEQEKRKDKEELGEEDYDNEDEDDEDDEDDDDDDDDDEEDDKDDDDDDNYNHDGNDEELKKKKKKQRTEKLKKDENTTDKENNEPVRRRRSSENTSTNPTHVSQRTRRKSSDDATDLSKVASPSTVINNANPFNEVESELEKMFAGIVENDTDVKEENTKSDNIIEQVKTEVDIIKKEEEKSEVKLENNNKTNDDTPTTTAATTTPIPTIPTVPTKTTPKKGKKGRAKGKKRKGGYKAPDNMFCIDDLPQKPTKKRKNNNKNVKKQDNNNSKKKKKTTKIDGLKDAAYDSGSNTSTIKTRGPVVHVQGPRDSPLSVQVVNAPSREDEEEKSKEKRKSLGNGNAGRSKRLSHQNDLDYRGKVGRTGLFSSTLSSRYDAHTTDSSWICVFCKQGPHSVIPGDPSRPHPNLAGPHIVPGTYTVPSGVLSDLFGPYLIGRERIDDSSLSTDEQEITNEQKKGCKNKRSLRYAGLADQFTAKMAKKKRTSIDTNAVSMYSGMTLLSGDDQRWEVWLHEQCALWAAGVYLAGGRVSGLQEAVWDATQSICTTCGLAGANIGCVKRGCKEVTHYPCALTKGWLLDTNHYIPKCHIHRVT